MGVQQTTVTSLSSSICNRAPVDSPPAGIANSPIDAALSKAALAVPGVRAAYSIRSRRAGALDFAELTISVDGAATVTSGHAIADAVESDLRQRFGLHEVVVHVEPCA